MGRMRVWQVTALLAACVVGTSAPARAQSLSETEIQDLFSKGKELFAQANELAPRDPEAAKDLYAKAAMRFERIVDEGGIRNGRLYYNIGNAYFRMNDIGRAILNYRRAERYIPNDPNLVQNLRYARSRCADKVEETSRTKVLKTLLFWHYDFATQTRSILFAVFFVAFWVSAAVRLLRSAFAPRWVLVCLGLIAGLLLTSLLADLGREARHKGGVILTNEVVARKGDSNAYEPSFKEPLHAGTEFTLIEDRSDWLHIELIDGRRCWVPDQVAGFVGKR